MKRTTLFFLHLLFSLLATAQDSLLIKNIQQMPVGVYKTQKSFFDKKPDIEKAVKAVVNYIKDKKSDSSIGYGYTYEFIDSSKLNLKVFAFCDGKNAYIQTERNVFFKCEGFGRHPYLYVRELAYGTYLPYATNMAQLRGEIIMNSFSALLDALRKKKLLLHYFNRKRQLMKATPEGVGFLLKKDKDFFEEYGNEPKKTEAIMLKYLNKMNERYPAWEEKEK